MCIRYTSEIKYTCPTINVFLLFHFFNLDTCGENSVLRSSFVKTCLRWIEKLFSYCADDGGGAFVGGNGLGGAVVGGAGLGGAHVGGGAKTTSKTVPAWPVAEERAFFKSSNSWGVIKPFPRDHFPTSKELVPLKQVVKLRRELSANDTSRHPKLLKIGPNHQCQ